MLCRLPVLDAELFTCCLRTNTDEQIIVILIFKGSIAPLVALIIRRSRLITYEHPTLTICRILCVLSCFKRFQHISIRYLVPRERAIRVFLERISTTSASFCIRAIVVDVMLMQFLRSIVRPFVSRFSGERWNHVTKPNHKLLI